MDQKNLKGNNQTNKIHRRCPQRFDCINSLFLLTASYTHYKKGWERRREWQRQRITGKPKHGSQGTRSQHPSQSVWREQLYIKTGLPGPIRHHPNPRLGRPNSTAGTQRTEAWLVLAGMWWDPPISLPHHDFHWVPSGHRWNGLLLGQTSHKSTETLNYWLIHHRAWLYCTTINSQLHP